MAAHSLCQRDELGHEYMRNVLKAPSLGLTVQSLVHLGVVKTESHSAVIPLKPHIQRANHDTSTSQRKLTEIRQLIHELRSYLSYHSCLHIVTVFTTVAQLQVFPSPGLLTWHCASHMGGRDWCLNAHFLGESSALVSLVGLLRLGVSLCKSSFTSIPLHTIASQLIIS